MATSCLKLYKYYLKTNSSINIILSGHTDYVLLRIFTLNSLVTLICYQSVFVKYQNRVNNSSMVIFKGYNSAKKF